MAARLRQYGPWLLAGLVLVVVTTIGQPFLPHALAALLLLAVASWAQRSARGMVRGMGGVLTAVIVVGMTLMLVLTVTSVSYEAADGARGGPLELQEPQP